MGIGYLVAWCFDALFFIAPLNWLRLAISGELPTTTSTVWLVTSSAISVGLGILIAYGLVWAGKRKKARHAQELQAYQDLLLQPLTEVRPSQALLKPAEKAYACIGGVLKETQTVGFSAGTTGMSVRVAKGVTLRTSGTRGHVVKGLVSVASGELVVTDQRVIFAGDHKSFAVALDKLLNTTTYADGFGFTDGRSTHTVMTEKGQAQTAFAIALHKVLHPA